MDVNYVQLYFKTLHAEHEPDWMAFYYDMVRVYKETGNEDALWVVFQIYVNHEYSLFENPFTLAFDWSLLENLALKGHRYAVDLYLQYYVSGRGERTVDARQLEKLTTMVHKHWFQLDGYTYDQLVHFIMHMLRFVKARRRDALAANPNDECTDLREYYMDLVKYGSEICKACIARNFPNTLAIGPRNVYQQMSNMVSTRTVLGVYYAYKSGAQEHMTNELSSILAQTDLTEIDPSLYEWIHKPGRYSELPIQVAAMFGRFQAIKALLALGANINVALPYIPVPLFQVAYISRNYFLANYLAPADCTDAQVLAARAHVRRCCEAARALMLVCRRQRWMDRFLVERIGRLVYETRYDAVWNKK